MQIRALEAPTEQFFSVRQVARQWGVSTSWVRRIFRHRSNIMRLSQRNLRIPASEVRVVAMEMGYSPRKESDGTAPAH